MRFLVRRVFWLTGMGEGRWVRCCLIYVGGKVCVEKCVPFIAFISGKCKELKRGVLTLSNAIKAWEQMGARKWDRVNLPIYPTTRDGMVRSGQAATAKVSALEYNLQFGQAEAFLSFDIRSTSRRVPELHPP
jgi:hypothetical protein